MSAPGQAMFDGTVSGHAVLVVDVWATDAKIYVDGRRVQVLERPRLYRDGGSRRIVTDAGVITRRAPQKGDGWFLDGKPNR